MGPTNTYTAFCGLTISSEKERQLVHGAVLDEPSGPEHQLVILAAGEGVVLAGCRVEAAAEGHRARGGALRVDHEGCRAVQGLLDGQHGDADQGAVDVDLQSAELRVRQVWVRSDPPDPDVGPGREVDLTRDADLPNVVASAHHGAEIDTLEAKPRHLPLPN